MEAVIIQTVMDITQTTITTHKAIHTNNQDTIDLHTTHHNIMEEGIILQIIITILQHPEEAQLFQIQIINPQTEQEVWQDF